MTFDWDKVEITWSNEIAFEKENIINYDKKGIYRLRDKEGNTVYIGSAYTRMIKKRLEQYFRHNDSGCILQKKLKIHENMDDVKIDNYFKSLKVSVYEYEDLENYLIKKLKPKHNKIGNKY